MVISSKNVFAPGAQFGAYSATKAAAHQLARIASLGIGGDRCKSQYGFARRGVLGRRAQIRFVGGGGTRPHAQPGDWMKRDWKTITGTAICSKPKLQRNTWPRLPSFSALAKPPPRAPPSRWMGTAGGDAEVTADRGQRKFQIQIPNKFQIPNSKSNLKPGTRAKRALVSHVSSIISGNDCSSKGRADGERRRVG